MLPIAKALVPVEVMRMQLPLVVKCDKVFPLHGLQYPGYGPRLGRVLHTHSEMCLLAFLALITSSYLNTTPAVCLFFNDTIMPYRGLGVVIHQHLSTHMPTGDSGQQWDAALN